MKYLFLLLFTLIAMSCTQAQRDAMEAQQHQEQIDNTKTIVSKRNDLGSRYNIFTDKQAIQTEYILIAEDGSYVEVSPGVYETTKVGSRIYSQFWKY